MAKKKKAKKTAPKKTVIKRGFRQVETKRGSNAIRFTGTTENLKDPDNIPDKTLDYHIKKNRPVKGAGFKAPRAVVLIVKIRRTDGGPMKPLSLITPPDFVVNKANVKKFIKDNLEDLKSNIEEKFQGRYEDTLDAERVNDYSLKFIY